MNALPRLGGIGWDKYEFDILRLSRLRHRGSELLGAI